MTMSTFPITLPHKILQGMPGKPSHKSPDSDPKTPEPPLSVPAVRAR